MAVSNFDNRIMKVFQATHSQGNIKHEMSRDIQCSCMLLMSFIGHNLSL